MSNKINQSNGGHNFSEVCVCTEVLNFITTRVITGVTIIAYEVLELIDTLRGS